MGRAPCCDKSKVKRGPWSPDEDATLKNYLEKHGNGGNWIALPSKAGLKRCGKSCRLRWLNYLRPDIKHGGFTEQEDNTILSLYHNIGSRWSIIASKLPGRTDNDVKNHWNTKLKKKIMAGSSRGDQSIINQPKSPLIIPKTENPTFLDANSCPILPLLMNEMGNYQQISNQKGLILDQTHETLLSIDNEFPDFGSSHECNNNNSIYNNISHITQQVSSFSTPSPRGFVQDQDHHHHQAGGLMGFGFESTNYSHHQLFNGFGFVDNCNDLVGQYLGS